MKKAVVLVLVLFWFLFMTGAFASGQEFGAIKGTVKDIESAPLPGVIVTLTGSKIASMTAVTSKGGHFRFLNLPVADDYSVKFELTGFNILNREALVVSFMKDVILNITLEMAEIQEEITVIGEAPVIDTKRAQVGINFTQEMLMQLPTARNPWVILGTAPGMLVDREDVGGNEGGQQSNYWGHGSDPDDSTWNIDGANITDNSALGAAPAYLNMSSYEEVQINYGNNDIKAQTGGVQINIVSKRGGNKYSGTFYLDAIRNAWQSDNVPDELTELGYTAAGVNRLYIYGANFGGPLMKDRLWFYASWGVQDIDKLTLGGTSDKTWLASGYARIDAQITNTTRANFFISYDNKQKWGRTYLDASMQDADTTWNQIGPGYLYKGEIEKTVGTNLYINGKFLYTDGGFALDPSKTHTSDGSGDYMVWSFYPSLYMSGNTLAYNTNRDSININLWANYFAEGLFGADHEIRFGVDYQSAQTQTSETYEADVWLWYYGPDPGLPTGEYWEAELIRDYISNYDFKRYSAFVQDTMTFGQFTINVGVRYDQEKSLVKDVNIPAAMWLPEFMPAVSIDEFDPGAKWSVLSPRLSLTYDLFGNGKDVIKLSIARYGSQSGNYLADFINPIGWTDIYVLWQDMNGDGRMTPDELYGIDWDTYELKDPNDSNYWIAYSSVNPDDPTEIKALNKFDPDYNSPLLDEISLSYEKELFADFAAALELFYKKRHRDTWDRNMMTDGTLETEDNYYVAGHNDDVGFDYYGRYQLFPYKYRTNHKKAYDRYLAAQIVVTKRLSHGWMLNGSFTYSDWKRFYEGEFLGDIDDIWYDPSLNYGLNNQQYFDGGAFAPETGGSGERSIFVNSRWHLKLSGLVELPYGFNLSALFTAREGYVRPTYVTIPIPGIGATKLFGNPEGGGGKYGDYRLPNMYVLNMRLEKTFQVFEKATVAVALDAFNLINSAHAIKQDNVVTSPDFSQDQRILDPRVFRFGIRFNF